MFCPSPQIQDGLRENSLSRMILWRGQQDDHESYVDDKMKL